MHRRSTVLLCLILLATGCGASEGALYVGPAARGAARCPSDMVLVPAGAFLAGATPESIGIPEFVPDIPREPRPRGEFATTSYCVDIHEWPGPDRPAEADVTWLQARVACQTRGKRLCTEDEWTKACGGPLGWLRPYGDEHVAGLCHADVPGEGRYDEVSRSGTWAGCASVYGAMDLEGNLSEWAEGALDPPDPSTVMQMDDGESRRGRTDFRMCLGGTMWPGVYGSGCQARHGHPMVAPVSGDDGFRCCRDPG